ncbi:MAG TPA: HRDC domain-containing protein [Pyrinomonadaceae bacterium]
MNKIQQPEERAYRLITETDEARQAVERLASETLIGLDTETYWDPGVNHSRVSLVQIAARTDEILIFDLLAIDVNILRPSIESQELKMAAHNARFDQGMLAGAGLRPASFVDTLRLARTALRLPSYSLASVAAHLFGIEMDKSFQKSNWRRRPLTRAQLDYAAMDALVVLRVYEELQKILTEQGRFEDALRFATLPAQTSAEPREPRQRRPPQPLPRPLTEEEKRLVRELKKWRLEKSFAAHVPAYMICPDRTLEHLVLERPATLEALGSIHGLGASRIARFGEELLKALTNALDRKD